MITEPDPRNEAAAHLEAASSAARKASENAAQGYTDRAQAWAAVALAHATIANAIPNVHYFNQGDL